ncbi:maintenance of telomere capping protein 1 [Epithele typhae]|uniref:maintenance of telomere capping protein 1 n=1 Tax=Epithele typhae TaxID=378194 RepID=UPI002008B338|nr:maintenance of telomere capping protein 1 [Epithele typhae]KAH9921983.1 maintenance of telomere capping protein 1 [Epithele typhae]
MDAILGALGILAAPRYQRPAIHHHPSFPYPLSKSKQQEALQFLDDLDSLAPPPAAGSGAAPAAPASGAGPGAEGEAEVFAFIDEITQKSSEPPRLHDRPLSRAGTPTVRKSTERVKVGGGAPLLPGAVGGVPRSRTDSGSSRVSVARAASAEPSPLEPARQGAAAGGGWGWGSVWSTASSALQQARTVVDEQVKNLPKNEQARKWGEGVLEYAKSAQLDKISQDFRRVGLSTLTDILNAVAPPISEHEVIKVWLSHDMQGYEGIEGLTYRALSRIMEQVEGGDLVVNRGDESRPKETNEQRDMNAVEGYEAALKLAQANLEELVKRNAKPEDTPESSTQNPTTYSYVYLRVQPFTTTYSLPRLPGTEASEATSQSTLQFLICLSDPDHKLIHSTVTQSVPEKWLELWDDYDWVEDLVVEAIRIGVEVIGQEYIGARMGWDGKKAAEPEVVVVDESEKVAA